MLPSDPKLKALKQQAQQLEIKLFDPRDCSEWPEWSSWWFKQYGKSMTLKQVMDVAPELQPPATFRKYFPGLVYGNRIPTEQFLIYRFRNKYKEVVENNHGHVQVQ